jgi:hypothetical protein
MSGDLEPGLNEHSQYRRDTAIPPGMQLPRRIRVTRSILLSAWPVERLLSGFCVNPTVLLGTYADTRLGVGSIP